MIDSQLEPAFKRSRLERISKWFEKLSAIEQPQGKGRGRPSLARFGAEMTKYARETIGLFYELTDEDPDSLSTLLGRKKVWLIDALRCELLAVNHAREIFTTIVKYLEDEYPFEDTGEVSRHIDPSESEGFMQLLWGVGYIAGTSASYYERSLPPWTAAFALFEKDADILARSLVAYLETECKVPPGSVSERSVKAYFIDAERRKAAAWLFSSQLSMARRPVFKIRTPLCDDPVTEIMRPCRSPGVADKRTA